MHICVFIFLLYIIFMCLGLLSTSPSHCFWRTSCHFWRKNKKSWALFDGLWPSIFLLVTFQRFFNGVQVWRLGWPWQGLDRVILHPQLNRPVWTGALSCWKNQCSELGNIFRAEGSKTSSRITLHLVWFMHPSQREICPVPAPLIATDPPPTRCRTKMNIWLIRGDDLTPVLYGPILLVFCKLQPGSSLLLIDEGLVSSSVRLQPASINPRCALLPSCRWPFYL